MGAPKAPKVTIAPAPPTAEEEISQENLKARLAAQKAMGRSKTMLSNSDVDPVTGLSGGASFLGG